MAHSGEDVRRSGQSWCKHDQGAIKELVKGGAADGHDSDETMMTSAEDLRVRYFWKVFINIVGFIVFFRNKYVKSC